MANYGMTVFRHDGTDYTINDPNIGDEFSASTFYNVGDHVNYKGDLYVFTSAHAAGAWNAAHAAKVKLGAEMAGAMAAIRQNSGGTVRCESGTFDNADGSVKTANNKRIRNREPIAVSGSGTITIPDGYECWPIRLDKNGAFISAMNQWFSGTFRTDLVSTDTTKFLNLAIRSKTAPTADISGYVAAVESGIALTRYETTAGAVADLGEYAYQYEEITQTYGLSTGQTYGQVGETITKTTSGPYFHTKIPKAAGVSKIRFSTAYNITNVSSYFQYVNNSDVIVAIDYTVGNYKLGTVYDYTLAWPSGATGMYVTTGWLNSSADYAFGVYKLSPIGGDQYDRVVKSVTRIADGFGVPHQSVIGYKMAYIAGFRAMLCDLRFTSDNVPVLEHDAKLNGSYTDVYDNDGNLVPTTPGVLIAETTYADLQQYDFGYYAGTAYKGTRIMTFEQMLSLCKRLGCEVWIETKVDMTTAQYDIAFGLIRSYGMERRVVWNPQSVPQMNSLVAYEPNVYINLHSNLASGAAMTDALVNAITGVVNDYNRNRVSITLTLGATVTAGQAATLSRAGVGIMATTLNTEAQVLAYWNQGKPYTAAESVLSNSIITGKVLHDSAMS